MAEDSETALLRKCLAEKDATIAEVSALLTRCYDLLNRSMQLNEEYSKLMDIPLNLKKEVLDERGT